MEINFRLKTKRIISLLLSLFRRGVCVPFLRLFVCFKFNYQLPHRKWHNKFRSNCLQTKPSKFPLIVLELRRINGPFPRMRCDWYVWNFRVKFLLYVKWCSHSQWYLLSTNHQMTINLWCISFKWTQTNWNEYQEKERAKW